MTARELRIGNWYNPSNPKQMEAEDYINMYLNYEPVPLSEQWLLKFGFEKDGSCYTWELNEFGIDCFAHVKGFFFQSKTCEIKYVHQLQNLYHALTGEELVLKTT